MRVRLLVSMAGATSYNPGDEFECSDNQEAIRLIKAGYAVPLAQKIERAVKAPVETRKKRK